MPKPYHQGELVVRFLPKPDLDVNTINALFEPLGYRFEKTDMGHYNCYVPKGREKEATKQIKLAAITLGEKSIPLVEWVELRDRRYESQTEILEKITGQIQDLDDAISVEGGISNREFKRRLKEIISDETKTLKD